MQITKEQIVEIIANYSFGTRIMNVKTTVVDIADFSNIADEILTLLQSNDASQPNGSKPIVSCSLPSDLKAKYISGYKDGWNDALDEHNACRQ